MTDMRKFKKYLETYTHKRRNDQMWIDAADMQNDLTTYRTKSEIFDKTYKITQPYKAKIFKKIKKIVDRNYTK